MEKRHVRECVRAELTDRKHPVTDTIVERVVSSLQYMPKDIELFSTTGCKTVPQKVDYIIEEMSLN